MTNEKEAQEDAWDTGALGRDPKYAAIAPEEVPTPLTDSSTFQVKINGDFWSVVFAFNARKIERAFAEKTKEIEALTKKHDKELCDIFSRRAGVEEHLLEMAKGKLPLPDAEGCRALAVRLGVPATDDFTEFHECPPEDVREWMYHLEFHLTEHDLPHAGKALRAAYPTVRDWFTAQYTSMKVWRGRARRAEEENTKLKKEVERLRATANALLHQIDIGDFVDSHGHNAKMLKAVHDLMRALSKAE